MKRQENINKINRYLAYLASNIEYNTAINLTDLNIHSENFYRDFLNLSLGYKLKNINTISTNFPSIDLGDEENSICIQITSTPSLKKTKSTVDKFIKHELYNVYDRLIILNIVRKSSHGENTIGNEKYSLDTKKDIWSFKDIVSNIADKSSEDLEIILNFLNKELEVNIKGESEENDDVSALNLFFNFIPFCSLLTYIDYFPYRIHSSFTEVGEMFDIFRKSNPHLYPFKDKLLQEKFDNYISAQMAIEDVINPFTTYAGKYIYNGTVESITLIKNVLEENDEKELMEYTEKLKHEFVVSYNSLIKYIRDNYNDVNLYSYKEYKFN